MATGASDQRRFRAVERSRLAGPADKVAPALLNTILVVGSRVARIVEVEAYAGALDAASHAFRGPTARNATMFGPAGHLYVYRSYGIHWCANVVLGEVGQASAVLLRAVEPIDGVDQMAADRPNVKRRQELSNGPGKLCAALGITGADDGTDLLVGSSRIRLCQDGTAPPDDPLVTARIGISRAAELPWRFAIRDHPWVSRAKPSHGL